jgi:hypothetical protein
VEPRTRLALKYLSYGWSVVPVHIPLFVDNVQHDWDFTEVKCSCGRDECSYPGKHPRVNWQQYSTRLPTEDEVVDWFERTYFGSNIGMVTGSVSGVVVVDVDGDPREYEKLNLPPTLTSRTGGGGHHYLYACSVPIRSLGQKTPKRRGFAPGIDLKAEGGFIVLPPSLHESGDTYEWTSKMPPATLDPKSLPVTTEGTSNHLAERTWFLDLLAGVEEGGRSDAAAKLAGRYAYLGLSEPETYLLMMAWNTFNTPPMHESEMSRTIRSVYQRHRNSKKEVETISDMMRLLDEGRS